MLKNLERSEVREYVKLLLECCEELISLFGDEFTGREILEDYYKSLDSYDGIIIIKFDDRIAGFVELKVREFKRGMPIKPFLTLGFIRGLKVRMLMDFFDRKPKGDEVYVRFIGVHPKFDRYEIGGMLIDETVRMAHRYNKKKITIWLPVESDFVDVCLERGFRIRRLLESSFAEKHMGKKYYYLLEKVI